MDANKPRVIQDFEKLGKDIQEQIKLSYPNGFSQHLIQFTNKEGKWVSALPFETDEKYYLVRMTSQEAKDIIFADDDYDDEGILKESVKEEFADKYAELDYMNETLEEDDDFKDDYDEPIDDDDDNDDE
jgi:phosphopantothenoylcysteine synthetase/decarboxylase